MKYIVEVREPVPSNLDEIAGKVAASFNITDAKALALLRRAPGAVTKAVSEREADVVAGIFERAGLNVTRRPVGDDGSELQPAADAAVGPVGAAEEAATGDAEPAWGGAAGEGGGAAVADSGASAASGYEAETLRPRRENLPAGGSDNAEGDVWNQPLSATSDDPVDEFSRRDDFEATADVGWQAADWTPESNVAEVAPEPERMEPEPMEPEPMEPESVEPEPMETEPIEPEPAESARTVEPAGPRRRRRRRERDRDVRDRDVEEAAEDGVAVDVGTPPAARGPHRAVDAAEAAESEAVQAPPTGEPERGRRRREKASAPARPRGGSGRSAQRGRDESRLRSGGLSRRVGWMGAFPPLLALVAMGAAVIVTVTPLVRTQQASQAADAAGAEAGTLEALTGGMPLKSQTLQAPLVDLSNQSQALLRPNGISLMVITDENGAPLAGWYGVARTPAAMPASTRQDVTARAQAAISGRQAPAPTGITHTLRQTWTSLLALFGQASEPMLVRAVPITTGGQAIGAVVVGVPPISADKALVTAFEMVLLVGLVPLLLGILMASGLTGGLRRKVQYLLQAADRISRGDLDEPVSLNSRDELGQLARAIERMRVSLSTLLEHRRRHR